ncbi:MAG: hypothetical protein EOM19_07115 [Candidatus Moranbacteria bacterium]|nr:hypothetical protein [Candidatus Moranbacteria bacterium]
MEIIINKIEKLKEIIAVSKNYLTEITLEFNQNGIRCTNLNSNNCVMIHFQILYMEFEKIENATITLNTNIFNSILKNCKGRTIFNIVEGKLNITNLECLYSIDILEENEEAKNNLQKVPELIYTDNIEVMTSDFLDVIKKASSIKSQNVEGIYFSNIDDKMTIIAKKHEEIIFNSSIKILNNPKEQNGLYSIEFLKKLNGLKKLNRYTNIQYIKDYPLTISLESVDFKFKFILAPRAEY